MMTFEEWVEIAPKLLLVKGEARQRLVESIGIEWESWKEADYHYSSALADDIVDGRKERRGLYSAKCVEEMRRRATEAPHAPPTGAEAPSKTEPDPSAEEPLPPVKQEVPTYLLPQSRAAVLRAGTEDVDLQALTKAALPFMEGLTDSMPQTLQASKAAHIFSGTTEIDKRDLSRDVMPFPLDPALDATTLDDTAVLSRPVGTSPADITLERYAEIMAHATSMPQSQLAAVVAGFGLTLPEFLNADAEWRERLNGEPALCAQFAALFTRTKARLSARMTVPLPKPTPPRG